MNHKMNRLSLAVRVGLTAGLIAAAGMAQAQQSSQDQGDQSPKTLKTVVVTGSLIRRVDLETASPVVHIDRQQLEATGNLTLANTIQEMPAIQGNATTTRSNSNGGGVAGPDTEAGDGAARVSLRGLGTGRTLVLINGQRMINADVNMIPQNMIQRVAVLAEGASTTYGSDAIGGVVNFILRDDFNGVEVQINDGISSHGDGQRQGLSVTMGHSGDRYNIVAGIDYNKFSPIPATRRNFSANQLYLSGGKVLISGSGSSPTGRIFLPDNLIPQFGCPQVTLDHGNGTSLSDYRCYNRTADAFNYAAWNYIQTQQQRVGGFLHFRYDIADNLTAFGDILYNHTNSSGRDAAAPIGTGGSAGLVVPADAPFNPFGVTFSGLVIPGQPNSGYSFSTRLTGVGPRLHPYNTASSQAVVGLRGAFGDSSWTWSTTFNYGHTRRMQNNMRELIIPDLNAAIAGGANIFNQMNDGAPFNIGSHDTIYRKYESLRDFQVLAGGNLWTLPAGPMQLSVGASYRKQTMNYEVDPLAILNIETNGCTVLGEACGSPGRGDDNTKEVYAETLIPLLKDVPGAYSLNVDIGVRSSRIAAIDATTTNGKIAVEWRPIQDLLVRGTVSQVFRAPTLGQLYDGRSVKNPQFNDPCVFLTAAELAQHQRACQYVPVNWDGYGSGGGGQIGAYYSGAQVVGKTLKPEHGKSIDFGLVYAPSWAQGFNTSVDFWHIYLYDTLVPISSRTVMASCFNDNNSPFCDLIYRRGGGDGSRQPGSLYRMDTPAFNLGTLSTTGVDFTLNYAIPHFNFGSVDPGNFRFRFMSSYTSTFKNNATPGLEGGAGVVDFAGTLNKQFGNIARWRGTAILAWKRGNWDAQWQTRYISGVTALNADAATGASIPMAAVTYDSLKVGYAIPSIYTRFDVGVDNLTDRQPPLYYQNDQLNTFVSTYDTVGRYYWVRATLKF